MKHRTKKHITKKQNLMIIISLSLIAIIAIGIAIWALFFRNVQPAAALDYAPKQIEQNAQKEDDEGEKMDTPNGGGAVSLEYSKDVTLSLKSKEVTLQFKNPSKSTQDMVLQLVIADKVIAESDRVPAGYRLNKLSNVDISQLSSGSYNGKLMVSYYNTKTHEKAILNTEIPVTIKVTE